MRPQRKWKRRKIGEMREKEREIKKIGQERGEQEKIQMQREREIAK